MRTHIHLGQPRRRRRSRNGAASGKVSLPAAVALLPRAPPLRAWGGLAYSSGRRTGLGCVLPPLATLFFPFFVFAAQRLARGGCLCCPHKGRDKERVAYFTVNHVAVGFGRVGGLREALTNTWGDFFGIGLRAEVSLVNYCKGGRKISTKVQGGVFFISLIYAGVRNLQVGSRCVSVHVGVRPAHLLAPRPSRRRQTQQSTPAPRPPSKWLA